MIASWDHGALWDKARVFLNRAMDDAPTRSFDERAFWASAALELLGKAALAKHSPALIADPSGEGRSLLIATGLMQGEARFVSVAAKTIFSRCSKAFRPFNEGEALAFAQARNEYVHGAGVGFLDLPREIWWPKYWAQAAILVEALDYTISDLVGDDRVGAVERQLEQNARNIAERVESLVERARRQLAMFEANQLPPVMDREWRLNRNLSAMMKYEASETCPACGGQGRLEAEEYDDIEYQYEFDDGRPESLWATANANSDYFSCPRCRLVLDGYELLVEAGLPETFEIVIDDPEPEQEYGND